jgi:signal transduction histidine kinase/ligand-binding sensor domain-containing protein/CheY-like chemotaxis protein/AraC-like DNA-binding protein
MKLNYLLIIFFVLISIPCKPQSGNYAYHVLKNISFGHQNIAANCFVQDSLGMIWVGTNNGLYNYDGHNTKSAPIPDNNFKTFIHALLTLDHEYLAAGTGNGLFIYDYRKDIHEEVRGLKHVDVRSLLLEEDKLWIGTLNGLYVYELKTKNLTRYTNLQIENQPIYALKKIANKLFLGTYNGLFEIDTQSKVSKKHVLPHYRIQSNQFVNALYVQDNTLWIGTENGLYSFSNNAINKNLIFNHVSIKSLEGYQTDQLLIGTDNGLFIWNRGGSYYEKITHDSRNYFSLANNIIWRTFVDKKSNIWVGTEAGFSIWRPQSKEKQFPIYAFSPTNDGNNFYHIYKDSQGWYWLGGDNGLIRTKYLDKYDKNTQWFSVDASTTSLPHNRIRRIYEDKSNNLWIASDGGVNVYDRKTNRFRTFEITDSSRTRNAKWAYDIIEDRNGNIWIATYLGGVFVVNKQKLLSSDSQVIADQNFTKKNGLPVDFANQIVEDNKGNIWILSYHAGIVLFDPSTKKITEIKDPKGNSIQKASYFIQDAANNIWIALAGEILKIDIKGVLTTIPLDKSQQSPITSLADVGQYIWVSSSNSIWVVNKQDHTVGIAKYNAKVNALYHDAAATQVLLGGHDVVISLSDYIQNTTVTSSSIYLTSIFINNVLVDKYNKGIRYLNSFTFENGENNLRLEFSDLNYSDEAGNRYAYRFKKGGAEAWVPLEVGENKLFLANLASGQYILEVCKINMKGEERSSIHEFNFYIRYPWYASTIAKAIYSILLIGFIWWVINFFRVKNRLKLERHARKNIQEVTKLKLDFFTTISHDLKTPLSLIIGPLSEIIHQTKNIEKKRELELIQKNAHKIHSLVEEVGNWDRATISEHKQKQRIYSSVSLLVLLDQIVERFKAVEKDAEIIIQNLTQEDSIYLKTDIIKLESILTNILSNAFKYNAAKTKCIEIRIETINNGLRVAIADNGIGISEEEQPYIFSKFYRSNRNIVQQNEGTGLGLHIVKDFVEQLGWQIQLQSIVDEGSKFTLSIPADAISFDVTQLDKILSAQTQQKKILLVEDNVELSSFIQQILEQDYLCVVCDNALKALEFLEKEGNPDLIISDYMMPVMDGLEFIKAVKKKKHTATIPVILLTAQRDKKTEYESAALGVDTFIAKPFDVAYLKTKVTQLLNREEQLLEKVMLENIQEPKNVHVSSADEKFLSRITACIEDNLDDSEFSVQRLSDILDIPSKQLYRKVKNIVGLTPVEYIRKIRLNNAAILLQKGNFSIAEVMYMVGFSNASYFSKCFQQQFGLSPKNYVEKQKKQPKNDSRT